MTSDSFKIFGAFLLYNRLEITARTFDNPNCPGAVEKGIFHPDNLPHWFYMMMLS